MFLQLNTGRSADRGENLRALRNNARVTNQILSPCFNLYQTSLTRYSFSDESSWLFGCSTSIFPSILPYKKAVLTSNCLISKSKAAAIAKNCFVKYRFYNGCKYFMIIYSGVFIKETYKSLCFISSDFTVRLHFQQVVPLSLKQLTVLRFNNEGSDSVIY